MTSLTKSSRLLGDPNLDNATEAGELVLKFLLEVVELLLREHVPGEIPCVTRSQIRIIWIAFSPFRNGSYVMPPQGDVTARAVTMRASGASGENVAHKMSTGYQ